MSAACVQALNQMCAVKVVAVLDQQRVVSARGPIWDSTLKVWDLTSGACLQTMTVAPREASALAVNAMQRVICGHHDGTLAVWIEQ